MPRDLRYSFLENNRFSRENSYGEKQLRELYNRGIIDRNTELWLWDGDDSRLAGTFESLFIRSRNFKERRLGIFGPAGSGKTAFLACCARYGKKFDDGSIIVCHDGDDAASKHLKAAWECLLSGNPVEATTEILDVEFSLLQADHAWEVRTLDYPGRLLPEKTAEWHVEADALFLFIDAKTLLNGKDGVLGEIRLFLDRQRRLSPSGNRIEKPVALVATRADRAGYPDENHPAMEELSAVASEFGDCTARFLVSVPIEVSCEPFHVTRPLLWAMREIDRLRIDRTPKTLAAYKNLRDIWGINSGESGDQVAAVIERLERRARRQRTTLRTLWLSVCLLALAGMAIFGRNLFVHRNLTAYVAAETAVRNAESRERVEAALDGYRNRFWSPPKHVAALETLAGNRIAELAAEKAGALFRTTRYAILHADTPRKIDIAFDSFRSETVGHGDQYLEELETLAVRRRRELRFRFGWEKMKYGVEQAESFGRTKRIYDEFLASFSETDFPEFADRIAEARSERDRLITAEREGVQFLPATAFYEKINRIDEQLAAFDHADPQRKALEEDRSRIVAQWEPEDYRRFYSAASNIRTAEELRKADELAERYLEQSDRRAALHLPSARKNVVRNWKDWFDGLKKPHVRTVRVKSLVVPNSFFKGTGENERIVFTLQVGKAKSEFTVSPSDEKRPDPVRFEPNLSCTVENAAWDAEKRTTISLTVAEQREGWRYWIWSGAKGVCEAAGSEYPYLEFGPRPDGVFTFTTPDGHVVTVTTDPTTLDVPELAAP